MSDFTKVGGPIPVNLGRCVDLYHDVRALRLAMEKEANEMRVRETELKLHVIQNLSRTNDQGAVGLRYMAKRKDNEAFSFTKAQSDANEAVLDETSGWNLFTEWVRQTGRFNFLQKRLTETAVKEWLEAGNGLPPGVAKITVPDISVTKV